MKKILTFLFISVFIFNINAQNKINGHEYVDLGLPSGTKWATCNVGANKPEECGNEYAWGETITKSEYNPRNSITHGESMGNISGNRKYDVARANWGGSWRMPTKREMEELKNKCTWKMISQSDAEGYVEGYRVTGPNGNSIFLPVVNPLVLIMDYWFGEYWSSTPDEIVNSAAYTLCFNSSECIVRREYRCVGRLVRPVSD